jgi:hypothetical protein
MREKVKLFHSFLVIKGKPGINSFVNIKSSKAATHLMIFLNDYPIFLLCIDFKRTTNPFTFCNFFMDFINLFHRLTFKAALKYIL